MEARGQHLESSSIMLHLIFFLKVFLIIIYYLCVDYLFYHVVRESNSGCQAWWWQMPLPAELISPTLYLVF